MRSSWYKRRGSPSSCSWGMQARTGLAGTPAHGYAHWQHFLWSRVLGTWLEILGWEAYFVIFTGEMCVRVHSWVCWNCRHLSACALKTSHAHDVPIGLYWTALSTPRTCVYMCVTMDCLACTLFYRFTMYVEFCYVSSTRLTNASALTFHFYTNLQACVACVGAQMASHLQTATFAWTLR